ncbi:ThuA domain-containing protein [Reichenbachiella agarivorans]|uniref:ThuA domain-containing protein n=1 Tax=Reichenbachiella agarivorans TaxID=2979464 RepID=A0ABY6CMY6_9BACT|nr:ThuA domain-containing protein [Reichenbachiella agarivorans]UXP31884.1 ThuA domain-containing protein [Reichenbachiella agarivorans]
MMRIKSGLILAIGILALVSFSNVDLRAQNTEELNVLVFSKTNGWRHPSIEKGQSTLKEWSKSQNWNVVLSEDSLVFSTDRLRDVDVVLFLNTTGDILGEQEQQALIEYMHQGGGFVGVHSAVDTEMNWPWFRQMAGARFKNHPKVQEARSAVSHGHPAVAQWGDSLTFTDEWYNYQEPVVAHANVVLTLDEKSYQGGNMGENHPLAWYHYFEGGRVFYTGLGHKKETYNDPGFKTHLTEAINWAGGRYDLQMNEGWTNLLDANLSQWDKYLGVPHSSVEGLGDAPTSDNVHEGTPLGLHNDPKNVFRIEEESGEPVLAITGEIYGGLTSKQEYGNYHFKTEFRWGEKKWEPRLNQKRDNGILYHCQGPNGVFWHVWMSSLEYQVQEGDMGDFIALADVYGDVPVDRMTNEKGKVYFVYNPNGELIPLKWGKDYESGQASKNKLYEKTNGEWNTLEIICVGTTSLHVVNGHVVNVVKNARYDLGGKTIPISSGKIQIQSEAAEAYYRRMQVQPIEDFPNKYKKQAKLK